MKGALKEGEHRGVVTKDAAQKKNLKGGTRAKCST